ncbi:MAG: penicillin-binding protein 1A [Pseudomonadota bacterium]|nr:penicillin-binding protein 1A [Pseudomonadota bacterium]
MSVFKQSTKALMFITAAVAWWLAGLYLYLSPKLPEAEALTDIKLQTPLRIMSSDGQLIGQFGEQKRIPARYEDLPQSFIDALLAAEDDSFFEHSGIDFLGLARAVSELVATGSKQSGGSTITMQVARNFFLTLDQTFIRKFTEILLALEIEQRLSKEEILELYVNRVFLGHRSYGFETAAQTYYGRSLNELSVAEHAMLAGVPQAPSRNNPLSNPKRSEIRRNWILRRMLSLEMIDRATYDEAIASTDIASFNGLKVEVDADYVAEMARQFVVERLGSNAYTDGYVVYTTVNGDLQQAARDAVIEGLITYDNRHGWRGPEQQHSPLEEETSEELGKRWRAALRAMPVIADLRPAIVTELLEDGARVLLRDGSYGFLSWREDLRRVRRYLDEDRRTGSTQTLSDLLSVGDLIRVSEKGDNLRLAQVPRVQGALVSLDPNDGSIKALVGGMGFVLSKFNRATQARRQPGSNFKAFLYAAALENGIHPATLINDAPVVVGNLTDEDLWRPENDSGRFYGPTRVREALAFSRNLVSIRILQQLGVRKLIEMAARVGFDVSDMQPNLTLALGTHAYTPLEVANGYTAIANGGFRVEPWLVDRIEDLDGDIVYEADPLIACSICEKQASEDEFLEAPRIEDLLADAEPEFRKAQRIIDERVTYVLTSMLEDVIQRGTGRRARTLERNDLAGKTGTTNGPRDAWFSGYNRDLVTTTWVGFDDYGLMGRREFGGTAALPIWIDFMRVALPPESAAPEMPPGVVRLRIDKESGQRTDSQSSSMWEVFLREFTPANQRGRNNSDSEDLAGLF